MIYCVEDDQNIRELIVYALKNENYESKGFEESETFFEACQEKIPHLVILDIMLPGKDGLTILQEMKKHPNLRDIPVIMLTAKTEEYDRIKGLDAGADDYISKPFSILELLARIRAVLRRTDRISEEREVLSHKGVEIDPMKREVRVEGELISLTYKEFELLYMLMNHMGMVMSRDLLMNRIWGFDFEGESRTVDVHIATLRQKLKDKGSLIETVRNVGYKVSDDR